MFLYIRSNGNKEIGQNSSKFLKKKKGKIKKQNCWDENFFSKKLRNYSRLEELGRNGGEKRKAWALSSGSGCGVSREAHSRPICRWIFARYASNVCT